MRLNFRACYGKLDLHVQYKSTFITAYTNLREKIKHKHTHTQQNKINQNTQVIYIYVYNHDNVTLMGYISFLDDVLATLVV